MGADLIHPADIAAFGTAFCTQLRLTRFSGTKSGALAAFYPAVRVEVRVVRHRAGAQLNCAALPTGWDTDVGQYGSVYLVSAAVENAALLRRMNRDLVIVRAPTNRASRARRAGRAFTLIEIIVALSAGVLVSMAAFAMSKNATTFFQHEARISTAQLALTLGLNRITADLTRASFLSSPNARHDPMVCRDPLVVEQRAWPNSPPA